MLAVDGGDVHAEGVRGAGDGRDLIPPEPGRRDDTHDTHDTHDTRIDGPDLLPGAEWPRGLVWVMVGRWRRVGAGLALVALIVVVGVTTRAPRESALPPPPTTSRRASPSPIVDTAAPGPALPLGPGEPVDLTLSSYGVLALYTSPSRLLALDKSGAVFTEVSVPDGAVKVVYGAGQIWVIAAERGGSVVQAYSPNFFERPRRVRVVHLKFAVTTAEAAGNVLWLGGPHGLFALSGASATATEVAGVRGRVGAIAADTARDRILIATELGNRKTEVAAVDLATARISRRGINLPLAKVSLAVTRDGIWAAGYGGAPALVPLEPATLHPLPSPPVQDEVGSGATIWAGETVIWVGGSNSLPGLTCIGAGAGDVRGRWPGVTGRVVSAPTFAFAIDHATIVRLAISRTCFPG